MSVFPIGSLVRLVGVPNWLIHDLPEEEQRDILSFIGKTTFIDEIDEYGSIWIGFGYSTVTDEGTIYRGHSFIITPEFLEVIEVPAERRWLAARGRLPIRQKTYGPLGVYQRRGKNCKKPKPQDQLRRTRRTDTHPWIRPEPQPEQKKRKKKKKGRT